MNDTLKIYAETIVWWTARKAAGEFLTNLRVMSDPEYGCPDYVIEDEDACYDKVFDYYKQYWTEHIDDIINDLDEDAVEDESPDSYAAEYVKSKDYLYDGMPKNEKFIDELLEEGALRQVTDEELDEKREEKREEMRECAEEIVEQAAINAAETFVYNLKNCTNFVIDDEDACYDKVYDCYKQYWTENIDDIIADLDEETVEDIVPYQYVRQGPTAIGLYDGMPSTEDFCTELLSEGAIHEG